VIAIHDQDDGVRAELLAHGFRSRLQGLLPEARAPSRSHASSLIGPDRPDDPGAHGQRPGGLVAQLDGATVAVYAFDVADVRIKHI
jgi:hypothetical protein